MGSIKKSMELTISRDVDCGFGVTEQMTIRVAQIGNDALNVSSDLAENETESYANAVCRMVKSWEMLGPVPIEAVGDMVEGCFVEAEQPIPVDPAIVKHLPLPLLRGIVQGIWVAADPKRPRTMATKKTTD